MNSPNAESDGRRWFGRRAVMVPVSALVVTAAMLVATRGQDAQSEANIYFASRTADGDVGPVLEHHVASGETREFYNPSEGRVFDITPSPSGEAVAVSTQLLEFDVPPQAATVVVRGRPVLERKMLHVFSASGVEADAIPDVRSYSWSPDGGRLVYVTGEYRGPYDNYGNTTTWIRNIAERRSTKIADYGYDVSWARFDNNIYIWDRVDGIAGHAVRYNVATGGLERTTHVSIYFSPSGEYYYHPGRGTGLQESVYVRAHDYNLRATSTILAGLYGWRTIGWAPDADLLLMEVSRRSRDQKDNETATIIFDPKSDTSTDVSSDTIGWSGSDTLVLRTGNKVERKAISQFK